MHITILAFGMPGDVEPLLALAIGLRDAGHNVRVATHDSWRAEVEAADLEYGPLHGDTRALVQEPAFQALIDAGRSPTAILRALGVAIRSIMDRAGADTVSGTPASFAAIGAACRAFDEQVLDDVHAACVGTDALVYGAPLACVAYYMAQNRGLPSAGALIQPLDYLGGPQHILGPLLDRGSVSEMLHRTRRSVARQMAWQMLFRPPLVRWCRRRSRPTPPILGPFAQWRREAHPVVYGFSPSVVPRPRDWPTQFKICGFWFLDRPTEAEVSGRLVNFLSSGDAPVYIDFGSMVTGETDALIALIAEAVAKLDARAVINSGWAGMRARRPSSRVLVVDNPPRAALLGQARVIVHHGGVMATAAALRSGTPSVVVPSVLDQFAWADRVAALGAGPAPVPKRRLSPETPSSALIHAQTDTIRRGACRVAGILHAEDGVAAAVRELETVFGSRRRDALPG